MNLKFDLDYKKLVPGLLKLEPYLFGLALIGVFGYTAFVVNQSLNVKASENAAAPASASAKISFDKKTIEAIKKLDVVGGDVPSGDLGKDDPFK